MAGPIGRLKPVFARDNVQPPVAIDIREGAGFGGSRIDRDLLERNFSRPCAGPERDRADHGQKGDEVQFHRDDCTAVQHFVNVAGILLASGAIV